MRVCVYVSLNEFSSHRAADMDGTDVEDLFSPWNTDFPEWDFDFAGRGPFKPQIEVMPEPWTETDSDSSDSHSMDASETFTGDPSATESPAISNNLRALYELALKEMRILRGEVVTSNDEPVTSSLEESFHDVEEENLEVASERTETQTPEQN